MKILVVDTETTGLSVKYDAIVELALVLVDTDTGEIKKVFDQIVKHPNWNPFKHKHSWIFKNSTLEPKDVSNAKPLDDYREEIQQLFDKYKITAFNLPFDSRFLAEAGFTFKKTKCIMSASHPHSELLDKRGARKKPSVEEIYNQFFMKGQTEQYIEEHRAGQDAMDEARIMLHLVELKKKGLDKKLIKDEKSKKPQSNSPQYSQIGPKDKFPFGKHKGKLFEEVAKEFPKYVLWCIENVKTFNISDEAKKLLPLK